MSRAYQLVLTFNGQAQLNDPRGQQVWASDSDEDFLEEWGGTVFLQESDGEQLLDYLVEHGLLTEQQADQAEFIEESAEADEGDGDEGEAEEE